MVKLSTKVCQHLRASGFNKTESARLASLTQKWVEDSGEKWAADRWKSLANYAHQRVSGANPDIPIGWAVRINSKGRKILRDGFLHRNLEFGLTNVSLETLRRMEAICRIPTVITADLNRPDRRSIDKIVNSITSPFTGEMTELPQDTISKFVDWLEQYLPNGLGSGCLNRQPNLFASRWMKIRECTPLCMTPPSDKMSPFLRLVDGQVQQCNGPRSSTETISTTLLWYSRTFQSIYHRHVGQISSCLDGTEFLPVYQSDGIYTKEEPPVGRISLLNKDGSAKIRAIASPSYDLQVCLAPMKQVLQVFVETNPCSTVFNQDKGREDAAQWLARGDVVYGYDQSSFTDRFPYQLQRQIAVELESRSLGVTQCDIELLDLAVHGKWTCPQIQKTCSFTYAIGQPMGLNPSFFLATLGHICVCFQAARNCNKVKSLADSVRIVGDDIVISDRDIASQYHMLMAEKLGVTINLDKSMRSDQATTFCGKLITKDGVVPSTKIKPGELDKMAVKDKLSFYGLRSIPYFKSDLQKTRNYALIPQPFGGGLKPPSMSYSKWIRSIDRDKAQREAVVSELGSYLGSPDADTIPLFMERIERWKIRNDSSFHTSASAIANDAERSSLDQRVHSELKGRSDVLFGVLSCDYLRKRSQAYRHDHPVGDDQLSRLRNGLPYADNLPSNEIQMNSFANTVDIFAQNMVKDRKDLSSLTGHYLDRFGYVDPREPHPLSRTYPQWTEASSLNNEQRSSKCNKLTQKPRNNAKVKPRHR